MSNIECSVDLKVCFVVVLVSMLTEIFNWSALSRWAMVIVLSVTVVFSAAISHLHASEDEIPASTLPKLLFIEAGSFIKGSSEAEREYAYQLDEKAYQHSATREGQWYAREPEKQQAETAAFSISNTPVTNRQYQAFVEATNHQPPTMNASTWAGYRLIHPFNRVERFIWLDGKPPAGREEHPVVLISHADATAYVEWLSAITGANWRLPTLNEWERAARGDKGRVFPWGNKFDASVLNSHDKGPFDTQPVGLYPKGASPHGMLDAAGQVFEWVAAGRDQKRAWVKGGSWDDKGCGVCRPSARHTRAKTLKHILIGFRVVREEY